MPSASRRAGYHGDLKQLFGAIHAGDEAIGLPPYNGGLFDPTTHSLERVTVPDADFAPLFDGLSRRNEGEKRLWINYRDLSVRQLGSIYERLLEFAAVIGDDGQIVIRPNPFARRTSGSYYTHDDWLFSSLRVRLGRCLTSVGRRSKRGRKSCRAFGARRKTSLNRFVHTILRRHFCRSRFAIRPWAAVTFLSASSTT